jgi:hypothetical protein
MRSPRGADLTALRTVTTCSTASLAGEVSNSEFDSRLVGAIIRRAYTVWATATESLPGPIRTQKSHDLPGIAVGRSMTLMNPVMYCWSIDR